MAKMYPKKGAAPAPMVREERAEAKMGKAAYARAGAAESPAKEAAEAAKGYACGGKVKGHADGGTIGEKLIGLFGTDSMKKKVAQGKELDKLTPKDSNPLKKAEPAAPAVKREAVPAGNPPGSDLSAAGAGQRLRGIVNRNERMLEEVKEGDRRE